MGHCNDNITFVHSLRVPQDGGQTFPDLFHVLPLVVLGPTGDCGDPLPTCTSVSYKAEIMGRKIYFSTRPTKPMRTPARSRTYSSCMVSGTFPVFSSTMLLRSQGYNTVGQRGASFVRKMSHKSGILDQLLELGNSYCDVSI